MDAWLGLAALKEHAAPYVDRISGLLQKADGKREGRGIDDAAILHTTTMSSNSPYGRPSQYVTKRTLIYELLGRLGIHASIDPQYAIHGQGFAGSGRPCSIAS